MDNKKDNKETITKETKDNKEKKKVKKEDKVTITKEEITAWNEKLKEAEEKALRAQAELVNYRKRKDEEFDQRIKFANEDLVLEILPVLDNFERAINMNGEDQSQILNGVKMIYSGLVKALEKFDVKEIESFGKPFDATYHQAVMKESDPNKDKEVILEVYQKGYTLKDKVIRPAMVKVND